MIRLIVLSFFISTTSLAAEKPVKCEFRTGEGTVIGFGSTRHKAQADAIDKCVTIHDELYSQVRHESTPEARYAQFIDSCAALECQ